MAVQVTLTIDGVAGSSDDLAAALSYLRERHDVNGDIVSYSSDDTALTVHAVSVTFPWVPPVPAPAG